MDQQTLFSMFEKNPYIVIIIILLGTNTYVFKLYLGRTREYINDLKKNQDITQTMNKILSRLKIKPSALEEEKEKNNGDDSSGKGG